MQEHFPPQAQLLVSFLALDMEYSYTADCFDLLNGWCLSKALGVMHFLVPLESKVSCSAEN